MSNQNEGLTEMARVCVYELLSEVNLQQVDLRATANRVADQVTMLIGKDLQAMLHPEDYPGYDPEHKFWRQDPEEGDVFEWDAETIEWVDGWADSLVNDNG
jgi:hypothetical protein